MSEQVVSLTVSELMTDNRRYLVPMYQRNYAWAEAEIDQLIQDVLDVLRKHHNDARKPPYYIGTLVVFEREDGSYEIIDGQQRFTTLTLMAVCLKRRAHDDKLASLLSEYQQPNLHFESRPQSSDTLTCLYRGHNGNELRNGEYNADLLNGFELLNKRLNDLGDDLNDFCDYLLNHVTIARVPVPQQTDLNRYFEVMNSRGEQLEKHEVLKARLMRVLNDIDDENERAKNIHCLDTVWNAVANMERYVQFGFNVKQRHKIFGQNDWGQFMPNGFEELLQSLESEKRHALSGDTGGKSLQQLLHSAPAQTPAGSNKEPRPEHFHSVINFPNFLLHVLRIWTQQDVALDDKQLIPQFERWILKADEPIAKTQSFVFALLKTKFLFDHYVIKREFANDEHKWSLQRLYWYSDKSQGYRSSFGGEKDGHERDGGDSGLNHRILMLLSAMHVSTPTPAYKYWLSGALFALYTASEINARAYLEQLENLARRFVFGRFLTTDAASGYDEMTFFKGDYPVFCGDLDAARARLRYGAIANNLVFNYLDYLIWCDAMASSSADPVVRKFKFTSRSSVEHFSPQTPIEGKQPLSDDDLHRFGNLCLISHSKNSRLSNYRPRAKCDHFSAALREHKIDSLKLYDMINQMHPEHGWTEKEIAAHEARMVALLEKDSRR